MTELELKQAKRKWWNQKQKAKQRGISWDFPFETWLQFWLDSGHWNQRGVGAGKYVMSRKGDIGPYSPNNVEIKTQEENLSEGNIGRESTHHMIVCPGCGYEYMNRTLMQHLNTKRCRQKKAPRRVLGY